MNIISNLSPKLRQGLPTYVFWLLAIQPVMDVASYWQDQWGFPNTLTLLLRLGILGVTIALGFWMSRRRQVYWIAGGILAVLAAGHIYACWEFGYRSPVADLTNFVRVAQMPLMALAFITFLREEPKCYRSILHGMVSVLVTVLVVELLSVVTGTDAHSYDDGLGVLGWFYTGNTQSAMITMLSPLALAWAYRKFGLRHPVFWALLVGCFGAMYFMGPRLCFLGIVATGVGLSVSLVLTAPKRWKDCWVFLGAVAVCFAFVSQSPMVIHQRMYEGVQEHRQDRIDTQLSEEQLEPVTQENLTELQQEVLEAQWVEALTPIYSYYSPDFVEIFGAERTIRMYDYTTDINTITATRPKKLQFGRLLMEESPLSTHIFGIELSRFTVGENNYDVENDLHGIYFLYGWAGLTAMVAFLGYFLWRILKALATNWKRYFTWDAAAWGISLCMCFAHVYNTAGVLRRPNGSIYLSVALAAVYYLVELCPYPNRELNWEA